MEGNKYQDHQILYRYKRKFFWTRLMSSSFVVGRMASIWCRTLPDPINFLCHSWTVSLDGGFLPYREDISVRRLRILQVITLHAPCSWKKPWYKPNYVICPSEIQIHASELESALLIPSPHKRPRNILNTLNLVHGNLLYFLMRLKQHLWHFMYRINSIVRTQSEPPYLGSKGKCNQGPKVN